MSSILLLYATQSQKNEQLGLNLHGLWRWGNGGRFSLLFQGVSKRVASLLTFHCM